MSSDHQHNVLALKSPVITDKIGLVFLFRLKVSQYFSEMNPIQYYFG